MGVYRSYAEKIIIETLTGAGIHYRVNGAGTHVILAACPQCNKKNKFFADIRDGRFICHNCVGDGLDIKGGLTNFVAVITGKTFEESLTYLRSTKRISSVLAGTDGDNQSILDKVRSMHGLGTITEDDTDCYDLPQIKLPPHSIKMVKGSPSYRYLTEARKIPVERVDAMEVYEIPASSVDDLRRLAAGMEERQIKDMYAHSGRVIFVQKVLGNIVGFIARDYTGKRDKSNKVLNAPGSWRQRCLYNWDRIKNNQRIIVNEGIVSAEMCGPDATATYGNMVSNQQVALLVNSKATEVVIMVEVGAHVPAYKLAYALMSHKVVKLVFMPEVKNEKGQWKDAADYTTEQNLERIESTPYTDEFEISMKIKEIIEQEAKRKDKGRNDPGKKRNFRREKILKQFSR